MVRFLSGLNRKIVDIVELQHYIELEDIVHMTMKIEKNLNIRGQQRGFQVYSLIIIQKSQVRIRDLRTRGLN